MKLSSSKWNSFREISYYFSAKNDYKTTSHLNNIRGICANQGFKGEIFLMNQVHSDNFFDLGRRNPYPLEGDALITNEKSKIIIIKTADCVPIFLFDKINKIIAVIHSGWRGTQKKIAAKVITYLKEKYQTDPKNISVLLGPAINACCYEIKEDLVSIFRSYDKAVTLNNSNYYLDLKKIIKMDLKAAGVLDIEDINQCTCCNESLCSHRRDKNESRNYNLILLR